LAAASVPFRRACASAGDAPDCTNAQKQVLYCSRGVEMGCKRSVCEKRHGCTRWPPSNQQRNDLRWCAMQLRRTWAATLLVLMVC
jgi:hypothetical protein